jgi:hypothetical protein
VHFRGNILIDWLANIISDIVTTLFKGLIKDIITASLRDFIQEVGISVRKGERRRKINERPISGTGHDE